MRLSAAQTALLLAVMMLRSEQTRARVSIKTLKLLSRRVRLHWAFAQEVREELEVNHRLIMFEIDSGGYGVVSAKAVEAAKPLTAKSWLTEVERSSIRKGKAKWSDFEAELPSDAEPSDDE